MCEVCVGCSAGWRLRSLKLKQFYSGVTSADPHIGVTRTLEQLQQFPIPPPHPSFFGKLRKNNLQQFPIPPPHLWQVRKNASPARIYARGIRLRIRGSSFLSGALRSLSGALRSLSGSLRFVNGFFYFTKSKIPNSWRLIVFLLGI